jgi:4-hydroxy-tetrahydrodipicolinate synthase/2-dehydro-3-deoxy-phosphogluconate/2-dehydro-3-deoxy-6-phosphogalactonate aldolase
MTEATGIGTADPLGLSGVVPPTITVFTEDEAVDEATTVAHAQFVVDGGAHGVFPLGTNGEFALLTGEERRGVVEAVCDGIDDVPVVPGVGAPSTHETVQHAEHAAAAGADGVIVVTPFYYPLDGEAAVAHYRAVADAVDVPVYVYHIPSRTGNALSLDTLAEIAAIDGVAGLKDSSHRPRAGTHLPRRLGLAARARPRRRLCGDGQRRRQRLPRTRRRPVRGTPRGRGGTRPRTAE